VQKLLDRF